jgi:hypothetical protein
MPHYKLTGAWMPVRSSAAVAASPVCQARRLASREGAAVDGTRLSACGGCLTALYVQLHRCNDTDGVERNWFSHLYGGGAASETKPSLNPTHLIV